VEQIVVKGRLETESIGSGSRRAGCYVLIDETAGEALYALSDPRDLLNEVAPATSFRCTARLRRPKKASRCSRSSGSIEQSRALAPVSVPLLLCGDHRPIEEVQEPLAVLRVVVGRDVPVTL
jgi:hypothetical protein